ncbi:MULTISPECIES: hypothetical protein [unclassified Streptomyces]|nr:MULTISPECIES: hypothetical protein [unclassified Streptomyces]
MTEHLAVTDGRRTLLVVRERVAGRLRCDAAVRDVSAAEYGRVRGLAEE